MPKYLVIKF